jgi:hypothetical protein
MATLCAVAQGIYVAYVGVGLDRMDTVLQIVFSAIFIAAAVAVNIRESASIVLLPTLIIAVALAGFTGWSFVKNHKARKE